MAQVRSDQIKEFAARLAEKTTTPEFLDMIAQVRDAPASRRLPVAQRAIEQVKTEGPLPDDFRMTTRTFEMPPEAAVYFDAAEGTGSVVYEGGVVTVTDESRARPADPGQSTEQIRSVIQEGIEQVGEFTATPAFQALLDELYDLPDQERPAFVQDVVLNPAERARRGIDVPADMLIQRSEFADQRPTLFCVSKVLPLAYPWHKVTVTFDSA